MRLEEEIKQKEFRNENHKAIVNLIYTFNWLDSKARTFFKQFELTPQQFNILRILRGQHPKPCTIILLKERMLDKECDASRIVERLRLKELLERTQSSSDRRSVDIMISEKGLELLNEIDKKIDNFNNIISSLSKEDLLKLNQLLDKARGK
ncbi:MAG TPA: MarR family transcriptional regulator [Cytophagaceae bacterium]|jgi:DNA-binding MarR family transcriptional regulator|nr:MarR family transcriptional regulator [Cytophagaceae bacterium]